MFISFYSCFVLEIQTGIGASLTDFFFIFYFTPCCSVMREFIEEWCLWKAQVALVIILSQALS